MRNRKRLLVVKGLLSRTLVFTFFSTAILNAQAPEMEWATGYGTDYGNHVHHGMQTLDGGYIGVGDSGDETGYSNMLIVKIDAQGQLVWQKIIGNKNQNEMANAIALAGSQSCGLMEFYGDSLQKRFNTGPPARNGICAAEMASLGFTGASEIIEGKRGLD